MRWSKRVSEELTKNTPELVALKCVDCDEVFIINRDTPLNQSKAKGHVWNSLYTLRHCTYEDWLAAQEDEEICRDCGAGHGPNPYTGCGLQ